jgi:nitrate reductase NapE component
MIVVAKCLYLQLCNRRAAPPAVWRACPLRLKRALARAASFRFHCTPPMLAVAIAGLHGFLMFLAENVGILFLLGLAWFVVRIAGLAERTPCELMLLLSISATYIQPPSTHSRTRSGLQIPLSGHVGDLCLPRRRARRPPRLIARPSLLTKQSASSAKNMILVCMPRTRSLPKFLHHTYGLPWLVLKTTWPLLGEIPHAALVVGLFPLLIYAGFSTGIPCCNH